MPGDYTRLRYKVGNDASGLLQQQGRVMLDQDWNELVEIIDRRLRAETVDIIGTGVVPMQTPHGFEIQVVGGNDLTIGQGRIYVDGMLAENHGTVPLFDTVLEETPGTQSLKFADQPYMPTTWPFGGTNPFAMPTGAGLHLVYLDVWKREATYLQAPDLIDKAVGLDTTTRLQTAWQVKVIPNIPQGSTCGSQVDAWDAVTARSAGQLTTAAAGVPMSTDPCTIPPNTGYRGTENRTYRVEVHTPGGFGTAQFKWSRNNASVASQVTAINATANVLTVVRTKRDSVLRFSPGAWVEVTDDWHEFGRVPGEMHQILTVDDVKLTITLKTPLNAAQFDLTDPTKRNTLVILWDASGTVRDINNAIVVDVDQNGGLIPITQNTTVVLEDGIQVTFDLDSAITTNPQFKLGDYWIFTARVVDASIDVLTKAPPRGIHHHYCRLAVVSFPGTPTDCRTFWPPDTGHDCECAVCVNAEDHSSGKFTIQNGIDKAKGTGGKVCLGPGFYQLKEPVKINGALVLQVVGHGQTILLAPQGAGQGPVPAILVDGSAFVTLTGFTLVMAPGWKLLNNNQPAYTPGIMIQNSAVATVERCQFLSYFNQLPENPAIGLGGFVMQTAVRQNTFGFWTVGVENNMIIGPGTGVGHVPTIGDKPNPLMITLDLYVEDNFMQCGSSGINLDVLSYHAWQVGISRNFIGPSAVAGIAVGGIGVVAPASRVEITGNEIIVTSASTSSWTPGPTTFGSGIVCGVSAARICDNDILALGASFDGIIIDGPLLPLKLDGIQIFGNRIIDVGGIGIELRAQLGSAMIKQNTIKNAGAGGIVMTASPHGPSTAEHLSIANNQLLGLVPNTATDIIKLLQAALGIRLDFVQKVDIEDNVIRDLGMDTVGSAPRVGIALVACGAARIAGNQIVNIGPLDHTFSPSAGIAVTGPPFDRVDISNNVIRRSDLEKSSTNETTFWRAIYVGPLANFANGLNYMVWEIANNMNVLTGSNFAVAVPPGAQVTAISSNDMTAPSLAALAEVNVAGSCTFTGNQGRLLPMPNSQMTPLALVKASAVAAGNNILTGGAPSLHIVVPEKSYTALGNITTTAIMVNNQLLAAPWASLNVHA
jgi:hypothetical protein